MSPAVGNKKRPFLTDNRETGRHYADYRFGTIRCREPHAENMSKPIPEEQHRQTEEPNC